MNKLYLLIFSTVVFFSYNIYILYKYGLLPSISASYYELNKKYGWFFTLFIWSFIIPVMMVGENGLMFMGGALVAFVGASPNFKELNSQGTKSVGSLEGEVHEYGALFGVMLALLSLVINFKLFEPVVGFVCLSSILYLAKVNNLIYWVEMMAFTVILGSLYYVFVFNPNYLL